jgi:hypothetical protein
MSLLVREGGKAESVYVLQVDNYRLAGNSN